MSSLTNPIDTIAGHYTIDSSVVPSIRNIQVAFSAHDLKPYVAANCFFDDTYVNPFIQPASVINTSIAVPANTFQAGEGLYCNTTHAYVEVIDTSQANILYVNENYTTINVTPYGPSLSNNFTANSFRPGDIVYQATNSQNSEANTFLGTVQYWAYKDGALVVEINNGLVTTAAGGLIIYKLGAQITADGGVCNAVSIVHGNKFPTGSAVVATDNIAKTFLVNGYTSNHGQLTVTQPYSSNVSTPQLFLNSNVSTSVVNSLISIVSGDGIGQSAKIISVNGNIVSLNTALTYPLWAAGGRNLAVGYAIGSPMVDDIGRVAGVFNIPEDQNLHFSAGNRLFTMNDGVAFNDPDATMRATAIFAATGSIAPSDTSSRTPVVASAPTITAAANGTVVPQSSVTQSSVSNGAGSNNPQASPNPLAQTFTVPTPNTDKQSYGIFCTSVDLFFQRKPSGNSTNFPVTVRLAEVNNGIPTTTILASATVEAVDVQVTAGYNAISNTGVYPDSSNAATITKFTFGDPVYLSPATEYALIVYSESPDYEVWTANVGEAQVNSTRLVSQGSFVGSFFEAQNSSAWNPIPGAMMMFVLNKAQFSTQPVSLLFNAESPMSNTYMDMALLHSSDLTFPVANITYSMLTTIANTGQPDTGYFALDPNNLYNFGSDLKNSSISSNRRRVVYAGNGSSTVVQATLYTTDPDVSPMFNAERLSLLAVTNLINNGGLQPSDVTITTPGNHINATNVIVTISAPTGDGGIQAYANAVLSGNSVVGVTFSNPGAGYVVAPTISFSEAGASVNATGMIAGETGSVGGNGYTRYLTKTITLADGFDAGDLTVFVDGIRPQGTDIQCYYKVVSSADPEPLANKHWHQMSKVADIYSDDQNTQITLQYNTGGTGQLQYTYNGVTYPLGLKFHQFAIKLVMFANDPTVPPIVQDYRAVAVPQG